MFKIIELKEVDHTILRDLQTLLQQLSPTTKSPDRDDIETIINSNNSLLFIATNSCGKVVGTLTLAWYLTPSGSSGWIEDVVVDSSQRGSGIGRALVECAIERAQLLKIDKLSLTSHISRAAAHRLYREVGFESRETTLFRFKQKS